MDLALNMLKYGPTMNMLTMEFINAPKVNTPVASTPKANPERPNIVNIVVIIADMTIAMSMVIMINPKYVAMQLNHPISSITSLISFNANAFENAPSLYAI